MELLLISDFLAEPFDFLAPRDSMFVLLRPVNGKARQPYTDYQLPSPLGKM